MRHHGPTQAISLLLLLLLLQTIDHAVAQSSFRPSSSASGASTTTTNALPTSAPVGCLPHQATALLRLKRSFTTTNYSIEAFRSWRAGTDCCHWEGVQCSHPEGMVTSLDLGDRGLESGGLDPVIFDLSSLRYLNLAYNDFNGSQLPSTGFERLMTLTHLNLSSSSFSGPVPRGISSLKSLVSLDLSTSFEILELLNDGFIVTTHSSTDSAQLIEQNFVNLIHKLSNLRELHLGLVELSSSGPQWCNAVAISCPQLQVLSLPYCQLSGPICSSISSLHSISVINFELNYLTGPFPEFFATLSNLTVLNLRRNQLHGWISPAIFEQEKLKSIDLYHNLEISGQLPNFSVGSRLENLNVGRTGISGIIPPSLRNLIYLKNLGLGASGFSGQIPSSIGNLKSLNELEISGKEIVGPIPSWIANLTSLTSLQFYECGLSGSIPYFLSEFRYLKKLSLCDCGFSGEILSPISNLTQLQIVLLYSNNFEGTVELNFVGNMPHLVSLDLSDNDLVVLDVEANSSLTSSLPKLYTLALGGCNISKFPNFLRHQDEIVSLDLSYNQIHGAIPGWEWELWNDIAYLDLSNNEFTSIGYDHLLPVQDITALDFSNNLFEGSIPIPQGSASALDYSNNMFSSIPSHLSSHLNDVDLFLAPGNHLSGNLSASFCGGMNILLLDLSYNNFSGLIPSCLMENVNGIQSLNLRNNELHGEIPNNNKEGCSFEALDFSNNRIEGKLPRSLVTCKNLEVFDVGNNQISDSFPCWMSELVRLQVLVLRSNKLFGQVAEPIQELKSACAFPSATIIDVSSNNFFGPLPEDQWFKNLRLMTSRDPNMSLVMDHEVPGVTRTYRYTTAITYKGHDTTFDQILTALVFLDFSNNAFNGSIPVAIGELVLLRGLNISHNLLTGPIPHQLGHLNKLEALDLSFNELSGKIPQELASLDFLTTLNLSDNRLVGSIPVSPHFLTFSNSSFQGNDGLCGPPLSKACNNITQTDVVASKKKSVDLVLFLFVGVGFGVGFAVAIVVAWGIPVRKWC